MSLLQENCYIMSELHSLIDFGMCVVLWLVQLVIYPGFLRIEDSKLIAWHKTYTFRVSFVIMPLMLAQLVLAVSAVFADPVSWLDWLVLILVILCWMLTFFVSVPLHRKIDEGDPTQEFRLRLIRSNWPRTILWTAIFLLGLMAR